MLSKEAKKAFDRFYASAYNNDILPRKTTLLLHLASAMAVACTP